MDLLGSDVLMTEALRAGPTVLILWLLLNRLERRVGKMDDALGERLKALETRAADNSGAVELRLMKERAAEDRVEAKTDREACAGRLSCIERELRAVWSRVGTRPDDDKLVG